MTVSRAGKHWFVSIQTEQSVPDPVHASNRSVGVDFGVNRLLTLSDGTYYEPISSLHNALGRLKEAQRKLSRMVKKSKNWQKQKRRIQDLHFGIDNR